MKILVSGLFLYEGKVGGAEFFFKNLLSGLSHLNLDIHLLVNQHDTYTYPEKVSKNKRSILLKFNRGLYDYLLSFFVNDDADIVLSPNYITPLFSRKIKVTVIHDVQYLSLPHNFSFIKRLWLFIAHLWTLYSADAIVCISDNVRNDIISKFGIKHLQKLHVIHNPIDFSRFKDFNKSSKTSLDSPFILSVAAQYPHKNLLSLIKAFRYLKKSYPDKFNYKLVLAGQFSDLLVGGNYDYFSSIQHEISTCSDIIVTGYVSDSDLGYFYENCDFFIFPSIFEGFGMPPVEAMGFGKPVITTRAASIPEVTQYNAIYLDDPFNVADFASKIFDVSSNLDYYKDIFVRHKSNIINAYDPTLIAKKYEKLFIRLLS